MVSLPRVPCAAARVPRVPCGAADCGEEPDGREVMRTLWRAG